MRRVLRIGCDPDLAPRPRTHVNAFRLHDAAEAGDVETLKRLLAPVPASAAADGSVRAVPGAPAPQAAEEMGDSAAEVAEGAIPASSVNVDERDDDDCTPLQLSLLNGHLDCARACIMQGSELMVRCEGAPAIHVALSAAFKRENEARVADALRLLLDFGAELRGRDDFGRTPLHMCAEMGLEQCATVLFDAAHGADGNGPELAAEQDGRGRTPLHAAVMRGHQGMVRLLLERGASVATRDGRGQTPLHVASQRGVLAVLGLLLGGHPAAPPAEAVEEACGKDDRGFTPMEWTVWRGHTLCARTLLDALPPRAREAAASTMTTHPRADRIRTGVEDPETGDPAAASLATTSAPAPGPTLLVDHPVFWEHRTAPEPITRQQAPPPPENVRRLTVLCDPEVGILHGDEFADTEWERHPPVASIADVLRVHEYMYVRRLQEFCDKVEDDPSAIGLLDNDTTLSHKSCLSALTAAGAAVEAVKRVCEGRNRNAFVALRPPGHHAGPAGIVTNEAGQGSHGFCLLNNVAIAAAYARYNYADQGIRRIAILDFDVHHGNGTEAIVRQLVPSWAHKTVHSHFCFGSLRRLEYRPWLGEGDAQDVFFLSAHGFGPHTEDGLMSRAAFFYPGSGETSDTVEEVMARVRDRVREEEEKGDGVDYAPLVTPQQDKKEEEGPPRGSAAEMAADTGVGAGQQQRSGPEEEDDEEDEDDDAAFSPQGAAESESEDSGSSDSQQPRRRASTFDAGGVEAEGALEENIVNAGFTFGDDARTWRAVWRELLIPRLRAHNPDLILISAGFDAHRKDELNMGFIGLDESDYEWVTEQIVSVANECCDGRVVSVLEGGYRVQGQTVSPLAQSVASHVRVMANPSAAPQVWEPEDADWERRAEAREARAAREAREKEEEREVDDLKAMYAAAGIDLGEELGGRFAGDEEGEGEGNGGAEGGEAPVEEVEAPGRKRRRRAAAAAAEEAARGEAQGTGAGAGAAEGNGGQGLVDEEDDEEDDEDFNGGAGGEDDDEDEDDDFDENEGEDEVGEGKEGAAEERSISSAVSESTQGAGKPNAPAEAEAPPSKRSRRSRGKVDYVALQQQMEEEKRQKRGQAK